MAKVTITGKSSQAAISTGTGLGNNRLSLRDRGAHVKAYPFFYQNTTGGTLADGSYIQLCTIGPGKVLPISHVTTTAFGTSRVLNIGTQEYTNTDGTVVAADANALLAAEDISSAVDQVFIGSDTASLAYGDGFDIEGNVDVLAQVTGGTIPDDGIIQGMLFVLST